MGVIKLIEQAAEKVGIVAVVTNSDQKLTTQLNRVKSEENEPMALITWDLTTSLSFNSDGNLNNPTTPVTMLLMSKADSSDLEKEDREDMAEQMGDLFTQFVIELRKILVPLNYSKSSEEIITNVQYQLVPKYGLAKHSGIIGRFTMISNFKNCD